MDDRGVMFRFAALQQIFFFCKTSILTPGITQTPTKCFAVDFSPAIKRPGRKDDSSPPSSAKDKNAWN